MKIRCLHILIFQFLLISYAQSKVLTDDKNLLEISSRMMERLEKGDVITNSEVDTNGKQQSLEMKVIALHPRDCHFALPKLALYENYYQYLDLVQKSIYNDATQNLFLKVDHSLMPFKMVLSFKLPRINNPGHYQFSFDKGFLKGLIEKIHIRSHKKRCLMMARADWKGPVSKIPDTIFEMFTTTLSKLTVQRLFIISRTL